MREKQAPWTWPSRDDDMEMSTMILHRIFIVWGGGGRGAGEKPKKERGERKKREGREREKEEKEEKERGGGETTRAQALHPAGLDTHVAAHQGTSPGPAWVHPSP